VSLRPFVLSVKSSKTGRAVRLLVRTINRLRQCRRDFGYELLHPPSGGLLIFHTAATQFKPTIQVLEQLSTPEARDDFGFSP